MPKSESRPRVSPLAIPRTGSGAETRKEGTLFARGLEEGLMALPLSPRLWRTDRAEEGQLAIAPRRSLTLVFTGLDPAIQKARQRRLASQEPLTNNTLQYTVFPAAPGLGIPEEERERTAQMPNSSATMSAIAYELNERATAHSIGKLQWIRARLQEKRRACTKIFTDSTIHPTFAFHHGGRPELQFNIGFEERPEGTELRYGVAFSFKINLSLRTIAPLIPKVRLFNDFIRSHPGRFSDMRM